MKTKSITKIVIGKKSPLPCTITINPSEKGYRFLIFSYPSSNPSWTKEEAKELMKFLIKNLK